jgi:hypothetical protein
MPCIKASRLARKTLSRRQAKMKFFDIRSFNPLLVIMEDIVQSIV